MNMTIDYIDHFSCIRKNTILGREGPSGSDGNTFINIDQGI